jgi:nitroimidazol reductase NimA-like FMN-containing flavoprotein (pyridoxamine 5'-phosphate oxidase superfamily)
MFGTLDASQIELLLKYQIVGRIGCHAGGITYVVPISYAYDGDSVFMHTHEGMKVNIMRANPEVCFQVEEMASMANWKSVIAWGTYVEITDVRERNRALKLLTHRIFPLTVSKMVHLSGEWPFEEHEVPYVDGIVFRIKLTEKTGRFENDLLQPKSAY